MKFNLEKLKQKKQKEVPNYMGDYVQECLQKDMQDAAECLDVDIFEKPLKGIAKSSAFTGEMKNPPAVIFHNFKDFYLRENSFISDCSALIVLRLLAEYEVGVKALDFSPNEFQFKQLKWLVFQNYVFSRKYKNENRYKISLSAQFFVEFDYKIVEGDRK